MRHFKPLTDYIDETTGVQHLICKACREAEQTRQQRLREIENDVRRMEEELERAIGGMFNVVDSLF